MLERLCDVIYESCSNTHYNREEAERFFSFLCERRRSDKTEYTGCSVHENNNGQATFENPMYSTNSKSIEGKVVRFDPNLNTVCTMVWGSAVTFVLLSHGSLDLSSKHLSSTGLGSDTRVMSRRLWVDLQKNEILFTVRVEKYIFYTSHSESATAFVFKKRQAIYMCVFFTTCRTYSYGGAGFF